MAVIASTGLLDLEKELTCSICTEILYRPLTLISCLHTFCGSCLKDWFGFQASQSSDGSINPFTCPSCRASVRETRPDAKITTLLDMFVQANPEKGRTAQEREDMDKKYKPGDNVLPKRHEPVPVDEGDRRMIEEIRAMSLADNGTRGPRYERGARHRHRSRDERDDEGRQRRRREGPTGGGPTAAPADSRSQARRIGHQSSLRSLLSESDIDSAEMEEEIFRQILEEGLRDGVDLNNLDPHQEDELSERIAEAYRRRHRIQNLQPQEAQSDDSRGPRHHTRRTSDRPATGRQHASSTASASQNTHSSHPPISRPHLLESYPTGHGHRRRTSSETRGYSSPVLNTAPARDEAARSATDLSSRPRRPESRESRPPELSTHGRRATDPRPRRLSEGVRQSPEITQAPIADVGDEQLHVAPLRIRQPPTGSERAPPTPRAAGFVAQTPINQAPTSSLHVQSGAASSGDSSSARPSSSSSANSRPRPILYPEPSIKCERCGKANIQYELHENCIICQDGNYNICHRCYRSGSGCLHWFGFGQSAWLRFQQEASSDASLPHTLVGQRYQKPRQENIQEYMGSDGLRMSSEDPAKRLESGVFCSICSTFAKACFWKCDYCNEGEWGYCNNCVNQGRCCTHPLLPVAHVSTTQARENYATSRIRSEASFVPIMSPRMVQLFPSALASSAEYRPLEFSTKCDICKYPVQPSQTRFHCYKCNGGDYDICATCYSYLIATGKISRDNGDKGWRRCLRGHRMIVVGFEDTIVGQRRIIVKDLVGGHALLDEAGTISSSKGVWSWRDGQERQTRPVSAQLGGSLEGSSVSTAPLLRKYPPSGGVGIVGLAKWGYIPQEGGTDELEFPKGAEIREVEDINGDWYWGCYAGSKGLFPAPYLRVLDVVTM